MARILVVEDDRHVLALHHRVIASLPTAHDIVDTANVYEALELVKTNPPHLIILDMCLAKGTNGNGFMVFFQKLLREGAVPDIPILLISGLPLKQLEGVQAAFPVVRQVFQKPFDVPVLREALMRWLAVSCAVAEVA
jgi:CheY-like chemotaxis protein